MQAYVIASVAGSFHASAHATVAGASVFRPILSCDPPPTVTCLRWAHALEHGATEDPESVPVLRMEMQALEVSPIHYDWVGCKVHDSVKTCDCNARTPVYWQRPRRSRVATCPKKGILYMWSGLRLGRASG